MGTPGAPPEGATQTGAGERGGARAAGAGPLAGLRFVELTGIGPVPMAATVLAGLGATGVRLKAPVPGPLASTGVTADPTTRGRPVVTVDIRRDEGVDTVLRLVERADVLLEGFRPGVMERRGLGPAQCLARNPRLVYGRMTGWGQDGPHAAAAGHDLGYLAVSGALAHIGRPGRRPVPPLNLVADYGGGSMLLVAGVLAALWERERSGAGQVVDAAMVEGAAQLMTLFYGLLAAGGWSLERGVNLVDGGAPFYDTYETSDHRYVAVACLEPQFYAAFLAGLGLDPAAVPDRADARNWGLLRRLFAAVLAKRTRDEWAETFAGTDACVEPVLDMLEAAEHPHMRARGAFVKVDGVVQPATAPRFSRTPNPEVPSAYELGEDAAHVLPDWGFGREELRALRDARAVY